MAFDLKALDEKIKKLQMIRQLAADPELAPLLHDLMIGKGNGNALAAPQVTLPEPKLKGVRREVFLHVAPASEIGNYRTGKQIIELMKTGGYKFTSKDHVLTVKEQLRELEGMGLVEKHGITKDGSALWRRRP